MTNPNHSMRISQRGLDIIRKWEGFSSKAYKDLAGVWTIGYGITDKKYAFEGNVITREFANELLVQHVAQDEVICRNLIKVPLSQPQWDAVISLCYNIGTGAFARSTLLAKINRSDFVGAYAEIPRWNKSGGRVVQGLVNRRKEEADLFLSGTTYTSDKEPTLAEKLEQDKPTKASTSVVPDSVPNTANVQKVAGGVAATAGVVSQASQVEAVRDAIAPLAGFSQYIGYLFVGVSLLAIWYMLKQRD